MSLASGLQGLSGGLQGISGLIQPLVPPPGQFFLVDSQGRYLVDSLGRYLTQIGDKYFIVDGNSLSSGFPDHEYQWSTKTINDLRAVANIGTVSYVNYSVSGQTTNQMISDTASQILPSYIQIANFPIAFLWEMTNAIYFNQANGTTAYTQMVTCCNLYKNAYDRAKVVVMDIIARGNFTPTQTGYATTANSTLAADFLVATANPYIYLPNAGITYADMFIKLSAIPALSNYNVPPFLADQVHLDETGLNLVADQATLAARAIWGF